MSDVGQQCYITSYRHNGIAASDISHQHSSLFHINSLIVSRNLSHLSTGAGTSKSVQSLSCKLMLFSSDETTYKISNAFSLSLSDHIVFWSRDWDEKFPVIHSPCKCKMTSSSRMENMTVTISIVKRILFKWGHSPSGGGPGLIRGQNTI